MLKGAVGGRDEKLSTAWMVRVCVEIRNVRSIGCWLELITKDKYACRGRGGRLAKPVISCSGRDGGTGVRDVFGRTVVWKIVDITSAEIAAWPLRRVRRSGAVINCVNGAELALKVSLM